MAGGAPGSAGLGSKMELMATAIRARGVGYWRPLKSYYIFNLFVFLVKREGFGQIHILIQDLALCYLEPRHPVC